MQKHIGFVALVLLVFGGNAIGAAEPDAAVKKKFDKILGAIKSNDRDAFVADGTDAVKEGTTQKLMDALHKQVGSRLKEGYEATYLAELKQAGHQIYLWKLTFKDGNDDLLVRLVLKDGKVAGVGLQ